MRDKLENYKVISNRISKKVDYSCLPNHADILIFGPAGSGKSSLAFETLYAEGQRRYIESLSNYTKQFLNKAPKPDIDGIKNIPPAISIEQKNSVKSSRSTVGTTTEVIDYLRLFFEKLGKAFCPEHHIPLEKDSPSSGAVKVLSQFEGDRGYVLAPIYAQGRACTGVKLLKLLQQRKPLVRKKVQKRWVPKLRPVKPRSPFFLKWSSAK